VNSMKDSIAEDLCLKLDYSLAEVLMLSLPVRLRSTNSVFFRGDVVISCIL